MTGHDEHREGLEHDLPTMQDKGWWHERDHDAACWV